MCFAIQRGLPPYRLEFRRDTGVSVGDFPEGGRQQEKDDGETELHHGKRNMHFQGAQETCGGEDGHEYEEERCKGSSAARLQP